MPTHTLPVDELAGTPRPKGRDDAAFVRARRHSRRVRLLKFALPAVAVGALAGLVGWSYLAVPAIEGVQADGVALSDGRLVMANPKLDGFTRDNLPYTMTAARAIQELDNTGVILLEDIDAKLPVSAGNTAKVLARTGVYDNDANTLVIDSPVTVTTTDGMVAQLSSARLDISTGELSTDKAVDITRQGSRIVADSMSVLESGRVTVFERRVRVNIVPQNKATGSVGEGEGNGDR